MLGIDTIHRLARHRDQRSHTMESSTQDESIDIVAAARSNDAFRRVIVTGEHEQVVVMTIEPGGEIGTEVHSTTDQVLLFVEGRGEAVLDGQAREVAENDLVFVRAGTEHNFLNRGDAPLRLITIYAPPEHAPGTVHLTKAEADLEEH
jgi:mannose-6-phosphate isomerase-like protein (cupin superfamily)